MKLSMDEVLKIPYKLLLFGQMGPGADPGRGQNSSQRVSFFKELLFQIRMLQQQTKCIAVILKEISTWKDEVLLFLVSFGSLVFDMFWCHVLDLDISTYFLSIFFNWVKCLIFIDKSLICAIFM